MSYYPHAYAHSPTNLNLISTSSTAHDPSSRPLYVQYRDPRTGMTAFKPFTGPRSVTRAQEYDDYAARVGRYERVDARDAYIASEKGREMRSERDYGRRNGHRQRGASAGEDAGDRPRRAYYRDKDREYRRGYGRDSPGEYARQCDPHHIREPDQSRVQPPESLTLPPLRTLTAASPASQIGGSPESQLVTYASPLIPLSTSTAAPSHYTIKSAAGSSSIASSCRGEQSEQLLRLPSMKLFPESRVSVARDQQMQDLPIDRWREDGVDGSASRGDKGKGRAIEMVIGNRSRTDAATMLELERRAYQARGSGDSVTGSAAGQVEPSLPPSSPDIVCSGDNLARNANNGNQAAEALKAIQRSHSIDLLRYNLPKSQLPPQSAGKARHVITPAISSKSASSRTQRDGGSSSTSTSTPATTLSQELSLNAQVKRNVQLDEEMRKSFVALRQSTASAQQRMNSVLQIIARKAAWMPMASRDIDADIRVGVKLAWIAERVPEKDIPSYRNDVRLELEGILRACQPEKVKEEKEKPRVVVWPERHEPVKKDHPKQDPWRHYRSAADAQVESRSARQPQTELVQAAETRAPTRSTVQQMGSRSGEFRSAPLRELSVPHSARSQQCVGFAAYAGGSQTRFGSSQEEPKQTKQKDRPRQSPESGEQAEPQLHLGNLFSSSGPMSCNSCELTKKILLYIPSHIHDSTDPFWQTKFGVSMYRYMIWRGLVAKLDRWPHHTDVEVVELYISAMERYHRNNSGGSAPGVDGRIRVERRMHDEQTLAQWTAYWKDRGDGPAREIKMAKVPETEKLGTSRGHASASPVQIDAEGKVGAESQDRGASTSEKVTSPGAWKISDMRSLTSPPSLSSSPQKPGKELDRMSISPNLSPGLPAKRDRGSPEVIDLMSDDVKPEMSQLEQADRQYAGISVAESNKERGTGAEPAEGQEEDSAEARDPRLRPRRRVKVTEVDTSPSPSPELVNDEQKIGSASTGKRVYRKIASKPEPEVDVADPVDDNEMDVDDDEYRPTSKRKADEPAEPGQPGKRQRKQTEKFKPEGKATRPVRRKAAVPEKPKESREERYKRRRGSVIEANRVSISMPAKKKRAVARRSRSVTSEEAWRSITPPPILSDEQEKQMLSISQFAESYAREDSVLMKLSDMLGTTEEDEKAWNGVSDDEGDVVMSDDL